MPQKPGKQTDYLVRKEFPEILPRKWWMDRWVTNATEQKYPLADQKFTNKMTEHSLQIHLLFRVQLKWIILKNDLIRRSGKKKKNHTLGHTWEMQKYCHWQILIVIIQQPEHSRIYLQLREITIHYLCCLAQNIQMISPTTRAQTVFKTGGDLAPPSLPVELVIDTHICMVYLSLKLM